MRRTAIALGAVLVTLAAPARADTADFLGNWVNPDREAGGIARIVVIPGDGNRASIRLFGSCQPADCDWGTRPARLYADAPGASDVRSLAADFDTPAGHRHLTLHLAVGHALRFELQTDLADGRMSYASTGAATFAGDWADAPRVADARTNPAAGSTPVPQAEPVGQSESGGFFGSSGPIGIGARLPAGYVPAKGEDCMTFNPDQTRAAPVDGDWRLGDFAHRLVNFGAHREAAQRAQAVIAYYHFDELCFVTRESRAMLYWKRAGQVPRDPLKGEICTALDPAGVKAEQRDGVWTVMGGGAVLLDLDEDKDAAARAVSVIRTYKLGRKCIVAGGEGTAFQYWLAQ